MTLLLVYLFGTIATSLVCSLSEAVILSVSPAFVSILEKHGRRSGRLLHELHESIDKPLAALLTINTISNTIGSILISHQALKLYGETSLTMVSIIATILILIFAEIMPKTFGALHAKRLAPSISYVIYFMVYITLPVVYFSQMISRVFSKQDRNATTREEMIETAEMGASDGVIHLKESKIIKNLLLLDKIPVSEIMTPRSVVNAFDLNETVNSIMEKYKPVRFSRIPLYDGSLENIVGLLHRYKLMEAISHDSYNTSLKDIMTSIHRVNEDKSVSAALDQFIKRREHLFLVVDKLGRMSGIVTLEDAIETLLGVEIVDEYDTITDMRQYASEQWRLKKQALLSKK